MSETFEILTPREHVRLRAGMYVGSVSLEHAERFVMGKWQGVSYVPALSKIIDEIIDNSLDEAIRTKFKKANKIDVTIKGDSVCVTDNGRGIPQDLIKDATTGEDILRPVAAWTKTNAGTSFTDDRVTVGANGVGSACANFLSETFTGSTWQKGQKVTVICTDGGLNTEVKLTKKTGSGTSVQFTPDFTLLETIGLNDFQCHTLSLIEDRLTALQMAFPMIKFTFNGKPVYGKSLKEYSEMFSDGSVVSSTSSNVNLFFTSSNDGFRSNSYINGVNTRLGGAYVDYVVNGVVEELLAMIKRKHKIVVGKATVKSCLTFVMFAHNFKNPKFDSQTKERLTSTMGNARDHFVESGQKDFKWFATKIMAADDIIEPIVEAELAKKMAAEKRAATLAQKKNNKAKVAKHIPASSPNATLFLCEGDSAIATLIEVRNPAKAGGMPLRGVPLNVWELGPAKVLANKELSEIMAVLGLNINDPNSCDNMSYADIGILVDADVDGLGHIAPLLITFFYKFWPRLFEDQKIKLVRSPIVIAAKGKAVRWFYDMEAANEFKKVSKGYKYRYIKGIGSLEVDEYSQVINKPIMDIIEIDDAKWFDIMFGANADLRKEVL